MKYNLHISVIFVIISCALTTNAQVMSYYGIKGGLNYSSFTGANSSDIESTNRKGIYFGGFIEFYISPTISFHTEINYSQKGAFFREKMYQMNTRKVNLEVDEKLNYFCLNPIIKFSLGDKLRFYALSGFELGILINSSRDMKAAIDSIELDPVKYFPYTLNSTDLNFVLGCGFKFNRYFIEARYNLGLTNLYVENIREARNSLYTLTIGCILNEQFSREKGVKPPRKKKGIFKWLF